MNILNAVFTYSGALFIALIFLYELKNYWITFFGGLVAFYVFYFSYNVKQEEWAFQNILITLKDALIVYIVSFVLCIVIYKIFPPKRKEHIL